MYVCMCVCVCVCVYVCMRIHAYTHVYVRTRARVYRHHHELCRMRLSCLVLNHLDAVGSLCFFSGCPETIPVSENSPVPDLVFCLSSFGLYIVGNFC
jgi:hypothetical protein